MEMLVFDANSSDWDRAVGRRTRGTVANRSPSLAEAVAQLCTGRDSDVEL